ncbi:hypothetical protein Bca4012_085418 [Brassica carinata]
MWTTVFVSVFDSLTTLIHEKLFFARVESMVIVASNVNPKLRTSLPKSNIRNAFFLDKECTCYRDSFTHKQLLLHPDSEDSA